jgi:F-type H+-transporting ATPase subunit a
LARLGIVSRLPVTHRAGALQKWVFSGAIQKTVKSWLKTILVAAVLFGLAASLNAAEPNQTPQSPALSAAPGAPTVAEVEFAKHEGLPSAAEAVFTVFGLPVTNSMLVTWIVAAALIIFAQVAMRNMKDVPEGAQNFWEWLVEWLRDFLEGILGAHLTRKTFWFLATLFIFILFTNWFGLVPGVGTIGHGVQTAHGFEIRTPLLRGGNADLNMPLAMSMIFFVLWTVWSLQANGLRGLVLEIFGPKGNIPGVVGLVMVLIFILVGFLEVISILFRPIALTFRLYGNMFAGENLLESMSHLIQHPAWAKAVFSALLPVPFYFMELLVGFVQALVFMLLCTVFTAVICVHEEEHGKAHH